MKGIKLLSALAFIGLLSVGTASAAMADNQAHRGQYNAQGNPIPNAGNNVSSNISGHGR